jgi:rare lipoprotein A
MVPVLINDRGPYITGRGLDVSKAVAERLGILKKGLAKVRVYELVQGRPSIED